MEGLIIGIVIFVGALYVIAWLLDNYGSLILLGTFAIAAFFVVKYFIDQQQNQERERRAQEQRRREAEEQARKERDVAQKELEQSILRIRTAALAAIKLAPEKLLRAEDALQAAVSDFKERAFYPFWDNLENSAIALRDFGDLVKSIELHSESFKREAPKLGRSVPSFPVSSEFARHLQTHRETMERVTSLARTAHKDFQFSSIFSTRKTNTILVQGFANLAQALDGIRDEISFGVGRLVDRLVDIESATLSVGHRLEGALSRLETQQSRAIDSSTFQGQSIIQLNQEAAVRQKQSLDMLDNIQKRRIPPKDWADLFK